MKVRREHQTMEIEPKGAQAYLEQEKERRQRRNRPHWFPQVRQPGQLENPEGIIISAKVDAGVRVYASRDLDAAFWLPEVTGTPEWSLAAELRGMLIVTKPTFGEAMAEVARIWANHDRNAEQEAQAELERRQARAHRKEITA